VYSDVLTAPSISDYLNFFDDDTQMKTISDSLNALKKVLQRTKTIHAAPVESEASVQGWDFGQNNNFKRSDILMAGYMDQQTIPPDQEDPNKVALIPDFVHKSLNTLTSYYGVGLEDRTMSGFPAPKRPLTQQAVDWYRALQIGYGFANSFQPEGVPMQNSQLQEYGAVIANLVKGYHLTHGIQQEYHLTPIQRILYDSSGTLVDLSTAIKQNVDFLNDKVYLLYQNGFQTYINYDKNANWLVQNTPKGDILLPPHGFVAWKQDGSVFAVKGLAVTKGAQAAILQAGGKVEV
jgi:hypothetical protein